MASSGTKTGMLFGWQLDKDVPGAWKASIPFGPSIPLLGSGPGEAFGTADSDLCAGVLIQVLFNKSQKSKVS